MTAHKLDTYPKSTLDHGDATYALVKRADGKKALSISGESAGFIGKRAGDRLICPLTPENARSLRERLAWLRPQPLGLETSFGFGDRLGLATPGHAQAASGYEAIAPIFAQQSVRENARTGRTPQEVMDDATWALFQVGWRRAWGADADHLKTTEAIDAFIKAGYTLYTIDPGDHVDDAAHTASPADVKARVAALPWETLETTQGDLETRYLNEAIDVEEAALTFDRETLYRAAAKYGRAIAYTATLYRHLAARLGADAFELEVSVDETETPTSPEEHVYIASELKRLGVAWVSLAPRYIGRFEKGVDYIGDLDVFRKELESHAAIARALGPYKLSIHSGSDKFSIYPIIAELTEGLVHVKTAGTSYLEALRAIAQVEPEFFRQILSLARQQYETDRATYHVSGTLNKVPPANAPDDAELPDLLDQFDARQVLHVTFGSVLDRYGDRLLETLRANDALYAEVLAHHLQRHLAPLSQFTRRI